jgi:outer membrane receptor protein involved in Fe transport
MSNMLFRKSLLATTVFVGAASLASPAFAQSAASQTQIPPQDEVAAEAGEATVANAPGQEIVVTGSRIQSPTITSVAPVQVVSDVEIDQSGVANIQDLLLENPVFGTPGLSRTNSAFLLSGTGVATVDLRDLGSDRTLVLINGRRVVAGVPGTSSVDLNVIPTQFIQRIDILTGGASSLYGSDAVAGVVNFIYKDNFQGLEGNVQYGITQRGDDPQYQANVTAGGTFNDNRGNMMVHVGYSNQEGLLSRRRRNTQTDDISTILFTGEASDFFVPTEPFFSSFVPQGRFITGGAGTFTFGTNNQLLNCFSSNGTSCGGSPNGFNRQFFRTIAVPVERYLFAARGRYEVTDAIRATLEGTYSNTNSSREIEPFPLESGGTNGIFPGGGGFPLETIINGERFRNPFVPNAIFNGATDTNGDGIRDIGFARRLSEFGTRNGETNRDFYRFVVGLEGDLFSDRFNWDVGYNYGRVSESQVSNGQVNTINFRNALASLVDVNDLDKDGNKTEIICADAQARANGCVPINIFGLNSISPAAVNYIAADQTFQTRITQQVVTANLSGSLFDLPAGPLGVAIGAEYRKETSLENNDALTNAGLNAGNAVPDTQGSFDVKEVYGELNIPLLADTPFFHRLNLRAAGRLSDYSTVGTVESYSVGAEWSPIPDVRLSGTYARAVRAPNIGELFTGPTQTFPSGINDPCVGVGPSGGGAVGTNCRAAPGVLANIQANGVFTLNQADIQGISGFNSGNPNLEEETSTSYTASVIVTPRSIDFLRNFVLRVDYYNIEVENVITAAPRSFTLNQCFAQGLPQFCALVTRRAEATAINSSGSIEFINAPGINGGQLKSEGVDVVLTYRSNLEGLGLPGALNARVAYTHLLQGYLIPVPDADRDPFRGEIGSAKNRFTAQLGYTLDDVSLNFTGRYIGPSSEDQAFIADFELEPGAIGVKKEVYLDMQARFSATENFDFYFGVDNLLDNNAPKLLNGTTFNITGTDTAADVYDVFGRRFYFGATLKF